MNALLQTLGVIALVCLTVLVTLYSEEKYELNFIKQQLPGQGANNDLSSVPSDPYASFEYCTNAIEKKVGDRIMSIENDARNTRYDKYEKEYKLFFNLDIAPSQSQYLSMTRSTYQALAICTANAYNSAEVAIKLIGFDKHGNGSVGRLADGVGTIRKL